MRRLLVVALAAAALALTACDSSTPSAPTTTQAGSLRGVSTSERTIETTIDLGKLTDDQLYDGKPGIPYWSGGTILFPDRRTPIDIRQLPGTFVSDPYQIYMGGMCKVGATCPVPPPLDSGRTGSLAVTPDGTTIVRIQQMQMTEALTTTMGTTTISSDWQIAVTRNGALTPPVPYFDGPVAKPSNITVAGILPNGDVVLNVYGVDGDPNSSEIEIMHATTSGRGTFTALAADKYSRAVAVSVDGSIAVQGLISPGGACFQLIDSEGAVKGASRCGSQPIMFSADGRYLAELSSRPTGKSPYGSLIILDAATSTEVASFQMASGGMISDRLGWDGDRVVAPVWQGIDVPLPCPPGDDRPDSHVAGPRWALAWMSADGTFQIGRGSEKPGDSTSPVYAFGAGPLSAKH